MTPRQSSRVQARFSWGSFGGLAGGREPEAWPERLDDQRVRTAQHSRVRQEPKPLRMGSERAVLRGLCWSPRKVSEFAGEKKRSGETAYIFSSVGPDHLRRRSLRIWRRARTLGARRAWGWLGYGLCVLSACVSDREVGRKSCAATGTILTSDLTFEPRRCNEIIMPLADDTSIGLFDEPLHADNFFSQHHESASCFPV